MTVLARPADQWSDGEADMAISMLRMRFTRFRTLVDRRQTHLERVPSAASRTTASPGTVRDETHQPQRLFALRRRLTIE